MDNKLKWPNTKLKPEESFEKGEYKASSSIQYKFDWNNYALNRFLIAKTDIPAYASLSEQIIKELYNDVLITVEELSKRINAKKKLVEDCLYHLKRKGFIIYRASWAKPYSLSELGLILAKQLK